MDMRKFTSGTFIKAEHVRAQPFEGRIAIVKEGRFGPEIVFESGDAFGINKTNLGILARDFGWDSNDWIGKVVKLVFGYVKFEGEDRESVIVETDLPPIPTAERKPLSQGGNGNPGSSRGDMNDEIPY